MTIYIFYIIFIVFELQKLFQFNYAFKLKRLLSDYPKIMTRVKSVAYKEILKNSLMEFLYLIVVFIGLFTINSYFMAGILFLSFLQSLIFKKIKNKTFKKIFFILDILLTIILFGISIINIFFYNLSSLELIKTFF